MSIYTQKAIQEKASHGSCSPVYALLRKPSLLDYPGHLCRVLFVSGCNLRCIYCHNSELVEPADSSIGWERLIQTLVASREYWVDAVCISGGEPTIHPGLRELVLRIRELGFKVKLDTNGTRPDVLREIIPLLDYIAMDYKAPRLRYPEIAGRPGFDPAAIDESVRLIIEQAKDYEFRTTVADGFHSEQDMELICDELAGARRYALQAYVPPRHHDPSRWLSPKRTQKATLQRFHELCSGHFQETVLRGV